MTGEFSIIDYDAGRYFGSDVATSNAFMEVRRNWRLLGSSNKVIPVKITGVTGNVYTWTQAIFFDGTLTNLTLTSSSDGQKTAMEAGGARENLHSQPRSGIVISHPIQDETDPVYFTLLAPGLVFVGSGDTENAYLNTKLTVTSPLTKTVVGAAGSAQTLDLAISVSGASSGYVLTFNGSAWVAAAPAATGLRLKNNGTDVDTSAAEDFLNIPTTNGTNAVLEFVDNSTGGDLKLKAASAAGQVIVWDGSAWKLGYVEYTA